MGWRVEFRPMELQLNDFENAAMSVFMNLLTRTIVNMKLNFLVPISKVSHSSWTESHEPAFCKTKGHSDTQKFPTTSICCRYWIYFGFWFFRLMTTWLGHKLEMQRVSKSFGSERMFSPNVSEFWICFSIFTFFTSADEKLIETKIVLNSRWR